MVFHTDTAQLEEGAWRNLFKILRKMKRRFRSPAWSRRENGERSPALNERLHLGRKQALHPATCDGFDFLGGRFYDHSQNMVCGTKFKASKNRINPI